MSRTDRTRPLANAVAAAFESAGYSPAELLQGPIRLTDLSWQAPPLRCIETVAGVPLREYLDYPLAVAPVADLQDFYDLTLFRLAVSPEEAATPEGFKATGKLFPGSTAGERKLALTIPEGFPACDGSAGAMFALEMAVLIGRSCVTSEITEDKSNFAVEMNGKVYGIVNGRTSACTEQWDIDCTGTVQAMLEQPRGRVRVDCLYDMIARLRSVLYEEESRFAEFLGLDYALQALRILADDGVCRSLYTAIQNMSMEAFRRKQKIAAYEKAIEVMESWHYPDRAKLSMLMEILVPDCLSFRRFCQKIYNPSRAVPAVLQGRTETRIINTLKYELSKLMLKERIVNPNAEEQS